METHVFIQPVEVEVDLDRRLQRGDSLIVEARNQARDGELVIADGATGACVGRYESSKPELLLYALEVESAPTRVQRNDVQVLGVVIGMKSSL